LEERKLGRGPTVLKCRIHIERNPWETKKRTKLTQPLGKGKKVQHKKTNGIEEHGQRRVSREQKPQHLKLLVEKSRRKCPYEGKKRGCESSARLSEKREGGEQKRTW